MALLFAAGVVCGLALNVYAMLLFASVAAVAALGVGVGAAAVFAAFEGGFLIALLAAPWLPQAGRRRLYRP